MTKERQNSGTGRPTKGRRRLYERPEPAPAPVNEIVEVARCSAGRALLEQTGKLINSHVLLATATALVPVPFLDMAAVMAIELRMIKKIGDMYGVDFEKERGRALVGALIGGGVSGLTALGALKSLPLAGSLLTVGPTAAMAGGMTYAVGQVFMKHFATGGTLLDFDPDSYMDEFRSLYRDKKRG